MAKQSVYQMVTDKIVKKLEQGVVPWRQPWNSKPACNWKTQKPYRGVNAWLLDPGEYATFRQIQEAGGKVKKGSKGYMVVFYKWLEVEDEKTGEDKKVPFLRYYKVFEINTQCTGIESKQQDVSFDHDPIKEAEKIVEGYQDGPPGNLRQRQSLLRPHKGHNQRATFK